MKLVAIPGKVRWHTNERPLFDDGLWWIMQEGQTERLPICTVDRGDDRHEPTRANAEKLARLFAAAPDLLEALCGVMKLIDDGKLIRNTSEDPNPDWAMRQLPFIMALKAAVSAIAKAEGIEVTK